MITLNSKGINLSKNNLNVLSLVKILLYADDITLFLKDTDDMENVLKYIDEFTIFSGLKINRNKSEAMWLGSWKNNTHKPLNFFWKEKMKILGVYFSNKVCASNIQENWLIRIVNCKRLICQWEKRNLSIMGKAQIAKTFLISQWVFIMQAIAIPDKILKEMNTLLFRFLWRKSNSNRRAFEKVKRSVMCCEWNKGGLNIIDLITLQDACLLHWASSYKDESKTEKWKHIANIILSVYGEQGVCFYSNVRSKHCRGFECVKSEFWRKVIQT